MSFLRRLYRALVPVRTPEVPWQPTGIRYTQPAKYDESKAREHFLDEQRQARKRRAKAAKAIAEAARPSNVKPFRRQA